jgi:hypothetical protein
MGWSSYTLLLLTALALVLPHRAHSSTVTVLGVSGYINLRACAQLCVWHVGTNDDLVATGLGCASPWQNDCYCRTDLNSVASSFLKSCCSSRCTVGGPGQDVASAIAVYNSYCEANGFNVEGYVATPTDTSGAGQAISSASKSLDILMIVRVAFRLANEPVPGPASTTQPVVASATGHQSSIAGTVQQSSSTDVPKPSGVLSTSALIGVVVSTTLLVLGALCWIALLVYRYKKRKWQDEMSMLRSERASRRSEASGQYTRGVYVG